MIDNNSNDVAAWALPTLDTKVKDETSSLFGKPASWYSQEKTPTKEKKENALKPLTLDDIEAIRQSAYDDGFSEGKEAGFKEGLESGTQEGHLQGLATGLEEGTKQGLELGKSQIEECEKQWESLIERLQNPLEKLDNNVEYQLINLATTLAEQIARCEIETNQQVILQALKQGVEALPVSEQTLTISLHPDDLSFVQSAYSPEICLQRKWDLQPEPTLQRGDCQIHTQTSSIDYAFDSRIKQVLTQFFRNNFDQLPAKNNDSNLTNDQPMSLDIAEEEVPSEALPDSSLNEVSDASASNLDPNLEAPNE